MVPTRPTTSLNLNVRGMASSATVAINERSDALRAEGRQIFKLGLGQSPFPVPEEVVQALRDHAHEKDYLPVRGLASLREAVAAYHARSCGVERGADDVLIGPGSKELMFLLQLVYYGDLVIPSPSWVSYSPQAQIIGRRVRFVEACAADDWCLTPERFQKLCEEDPERPRLFILNYPNNPTGGTYSAEALEQIARVAREHRVLLLSDEIYGELHHRGEHKSIALYYPEGTIISSGLSKWCGAGGWRLGTFVFPPELRWLLDAMAAAASETYTSTSAPIQYAAVSAFRGSPSIDRYLTDSRRILRALGAHLSARLREAGAVCPSPSGAFYLFADFSQLRPALEARRLVDGPTLAEHILEETGVAVLPGSHFGRPLSELSLRLAYVNFDGAAALKAAAALEGDLAEPFLRQQCGDVLEAVERLCEWIQREGS